MSSLSTDEKDRIRVLVETTLSDKMYSTEHKEYRIAKFEKFHQDFSFDNPLIDIKNFPTLPDLSFITLKENHLSRWLEHRNLLNFIVYVKELENRIKVLEGG